MGSTILVTALFLRIFSNSLSNVYQKKLTLNNLRPLAINAFTYILLSLFILPFLFVKGLPQLTLAFWQNSIIVGILGALGNGFIIKALDGGELSVLAPINSYKPVVALIVGIFMLKEIPSITGILGMFLVVAGSYFILDTTENGFRKELLHNKSVQYRFLALIFSATEAIFIKQVIILSTPFIALVSWCVFGAIFSIILSKINNINFSKSIATIKKQNVLYLLKIVLCVGIMQFSTNYLFKVMNVSYALSLFQLSSLVSVYLGYRIFKEKHLIKKLVASAIMVIGAVLIIIL